ncbi:RPA49 [Candida oxycetoniae]|uniref:RPA49 n=1 Tax=Candida oxycetoniae TaxID=497107 RepID=A0AAI9ST30_9ASCO|nr:RPA49 [Candida oxycetoniae]KAI3402356.1 RPA49 [Candida oxycetoniae]
MSTPSVKVHSYSEEPVAYVGSFFNGLAVPKGTEFEVYQHKKNGDFLVHGESETLEYNGKTSADENEYVVAVYDRNKNAVELYKTPYIPTKVTAKKNRVYKGPLVKSFGLKNVAQRKALGEAFGTKKAKAAITNLEKNRIDSDKLQDIELDIVDTVQESTKPLEIEKATGPVPNPNVHATNVEDVYPIDSIVPQKTWGYIRAQPLLSDPTPLNLLPSQPEFVKPILSKLRDAKNIKGLQLLYYSALLFGVYENRRVSQKEALMTRLKNIPSEVLVDNILDQFAISRSSKFGRSKEKSFTIDPHHEDKLLCYLFIILLHLSNFSIELNPLAKDLKMKPTRLVALFRALGATIKSATVAEAEALGIPKSAAGTYKIANLKVPFKLPEITRKKFRS